MSKFATQLLLALLFVSPLMGQEKQLVVVIIGGGPAGLGAAIEAHEAGSKVIVVEKRDRYSRAQYVFLFETALTLLNKWKVSLPELTIGSDGEERVGFTKIKYLESALAKRVQELGIPILLGEFKEIKEKHVLISQNNEKTWLAFDCLVGADGAHSCVRRQLGIGYKVYGTAVGLIALLHKQNDSIEFVFPIQHEDLFINKVSIPFATIISGQAKELSKKMLGSAARFEGWVEESRQIFSENALFFENIEIVLQQAYTYSDFSKSAILIGDAAAAASFLQGMGANCAIEAAHVAGLLFKSELKESDYEAFNRALKEITDRLIADSAFLFN